MPPVSPLTIGLADFLHGQQQANAAKGALEGPVLGEKLLSSAITAQSHSKDQMISLLDAMLKMKSLNEPGVAGRLTLEDQIKAADEQRKMLVKQQTAVSAVVNQYSAAIKNGEVTVGKTVMPIKTQDDASAYFQSLLAAEGNKQGVSLTPDLFQNRLGSETQALYKKLPSTALARFTGGILPDSLNPLGAGKGLMGNAPQPAMTSVFNPDGTPPARTVGQTRLPSPSTTTNDLALNAASYYQNPANLQAFKALPPSQQQIVIQSLRKRK